MKKITYIISNIDRAIIFEWIVEMISKDFQLSFILMNPGPSFFEDYLRKNGVEVHRIRFRGKKDWLTALFKITGYLKRIRPAVLHAHFFDATVIGLLSGKLVSVKQRIYTRHHSNLHHVYYKKGIWWDRFINRLSTHIIAISGIVKDILEKWEKVPVKKIVYIPHGLKVEDFEQVSCSRIKEFKEKHSIGDGSFVVGVISRFTEWKGLQYIIPAFKNYLKENPTSILLMLNAYGDYQSEVEKLLSEIPRENYRLIPFERDIAAALKSFDVFVHTPIDEHSEAFGLVYIEALAAKTASIFTLSGIAPDFIRDRYNALTVPFCDEQAIFEAMKELAASQSMRQQIAVNGFGDVKRLFPLPKMVGELERLYSRS